MSNQYAIGVDIGGTKIAFARVDSHGQVISSHQIPTDPSAGVDSLLERLAAGIEQAAEGHAIIGVGIGCPGHVDEESVRDAANLGWSSVPLRAEVKRRLSSDWPVWIRNDGDANALGEMLYGAAQGCGDILYVAIGTGLGAGIIVNGELVAGTNAYAAEIGHVSFDSTARLCNCGLRGCPEIYVSGVGLLAGLREHAPNYPDSPLIEAMTTAAALAAAKTGDPLALTVLAESREWLLRVLAVHAAMLNPEKIVIGGGLGHAAREYFITGIQEALKTRLLPATWEKLTVIEAQLPSSAVGAAALVWHNVRA